MKRIIYLAMIAMLVGCTEVKQVEPEELTPKFAYQQEVTVQRGFLKGQSGKIVGYKTCNEAQDNAYICYDLKLNQAFDGQEQAATWQNVAESDLL